MPFLMIRNDITKVQADAIVNPANEDLLEGSGTSYAIYQAAGEDTLNEACARIGHCDLGKAVITAGFNLSARYIIHSVGPVYRDGLGNEDDLLYSAYWESMKLAMEYGCESIAFPLLSSGSYGYPKDKAMQVAVSAISQFLMEHDLLVFMVLYDKESVSVSQKLFTSIEEYIDDHYVDENEEFLSIPKARAQMAAPSGNVSSGEDSMRVPTFLKPKRSLDKLMDNLDETFSQRLLRLIDERGLKDSTVYKKANVDRRHFSKIRKDVFYAPTKKTVLSFAVALELSLDETIDLLKCAGYAFSKSSKFDVIICYFIENKSYNIFEINEMLFAYDQPILG
ncbi:MAG: phosphatase [Clostridia bacterium]|nr:macro domain-containing protein [Lachnospiraceae bacterium]NCC00684.1 phosphatase [Clostridia bacterium]NCD02697.1 phosphatase [Clostridia bacterium]